MHRINKLGKFTHFKALFLAVPINFREPALSKVEKKPWQGLSSVVIAVFDSLSRFSSCYWSAVSKARAKLHSFLTSRSCNAVIRRIDPRTYKQSHTPTVVRGGG